MSFSDVERTELIAALSKTADMVELLLRQIDLLIFAQESGRRLTDAELTQLHDHQTIWCGDLERLRNRLASITIERRRGCSESDPRGDAVKRRRTVSDHWTRRPYFDSVYTLDIRLADDAKKAIQLLDQRR